MLAVILVSDLFNYLFIYLSLLQFSPLSWYNIRSWLALTYQLFINGRSWLAPILYQLFIYLVFLFFSFCCVAVTTLLHREHDLCMNILSVLQAYSRHHHHYHHQKNKCERVTVAAENKSRNASAQRLPGMCFPRWKLIVISWTCAKLITLSFVVSAWRKWWHNNTVWLLIHSFIHLFINDPALFWAVSQHTDTGKNIKAMIKW